MAQPLSYEDPEEVVFITTKTIGGRLWFVNNPELERLVLSYLAKYQEIYGVIIYAFIVMGNHYHLIARFPRGNRAQFMRAFNAILAKLVIEHVPNYVGGKLWARRYSFQVLPRSEDVLHWFFYAALNPVTSKLCSDPRDYPSYNSFWDAASNTKRDYVVFDRMAYNERKRYDPSVKRKDYEKTYTLSFSRLPGMEDLGPERYEKELKASFEQRRQDLIAEKEFVPKDVIQKTVPGAKPYKTKRSTRYSFRPLVLTLCARAKEEFLKKYFDLLDKFKEASGKFLQGIADVVFPSGTYPPCKVGVK